MVARRVKGALACLLLSACCAARATGPSEQDAARLAHEGHFAEAAALYRTLVAAHPKAIGLRLELADALAKDRQWEAAIAEYEAVLKLQPKNAEALLGIGTVRRWQGHVEEARRAYQRAQTLAPDHPDAKLGLATTEILDHDFGAARRQYDEAARRWPQDTEVRTAAEHFCHLSNPRVYLYYEDDLSFRTEQLGLAVPVAAREEFGLEGQRETRFDYRTGDKAYIRDDAKLLYTHFFGFNHTLDFSARKSTYDYVAGLPTGPFSSAIDTFEEYRLRYTYPFVPEQIGAVRYTARPTMLFYGQTFTAHKLEVELRSAWTPRLRTLLGTGWLRDLAENPVSEADLKNYTLVKAGVEVDPTNHLTLGALYITNPDLDNTINNTTLVQASYDFGRDFAGLLRYRADDYKMGDNQHSLYAGLRYTPGSQWWTEAGVKYVERGPYHGYYPLLSVVYNF